MTLNNLLNGISLGKRIPQKIFDFSYSIYSEQSSDLNFKRMYNFSKIKTITYSALTFGGGLAGVSSVTLTSADESVVYGIAFTGAISILAGIFALKRLSYHSLLKGKKTENKEKNYI